MNYTYTAQTRNNHVRMAIHGQFKTLEDLVSLERWLIDEAEVRERNCFLLDERDVVEVTGILEAYRLGEALERTQFAAKGIRIASLRSEFNFHYGLFLETVLRNRSINFQAFLTEPQALEWLDTERCAERKTGYQ